jgi:hypothetical protein
MQDIISKLKKEAMFQLKKVESEMGLLWVAQKTGISYSTLRGYLWRKDIPAKQISTVNKLYETYMRGKNGNNSRSKKSPV